MAAVAAGARCWAIAAVLGAARVRCIAAVAAKGWLLLRWVATSQGRTRTDSRTRWLVLRVRVVPVRMDGRMASCNQVSRIFSIFILHTVFIDDLDDLVLSCLPRGGPQHNLRNARTDASGTPAPATRGPHARRRVYSLGRGRRRRPTDGAHRQCDRPPPEGRACWRAAQRKRWPPLPILLKHPKRLCAAALTWTKTPKKSVTLASDD